MQKPVTMAGGMHINEKAFVKRFVFGDSESRKFRTKSKVRAATDVLDVLSLTHSGLVVHCGG